MLLLRRRHVELLWFVSYFNIVKKTLHATVYNYHIWRYYERKYLPECAAILVTVPEAKEVLIQLGISGSIIHPISNTEDETTFLVSKNSVNNNLIMKYFLMRASLNCLKIWVLVRNRNFTIYTILGHIFMFFEKTDRTIVVCNMLQNVSDILDFS